MAFKFILKLFLCFLACHCALLSEIGYVEPWGKDQELIVRSPMMPPPAPPTRTLLAQALEQAILFHQNIISPVDGPRSHFRPTSSRYMLLAVRRHGLIKGIVMGCDRLLRENKDPWVYRTKTIDDQIYKWDPTY